MDNNIIAWCRFELNYLSLSRNNEQYLFQNCDDIFTKDPDKFRITFYAYKRILKHIRRIKINRLFKKQLEFTDNPHFIWSVLSNHYIYRCK